MKFKSLKIIILLYFLFVRANSTEIGKIYSIDYPNLTEINFGPCFVGDSINSRFILENYSDLKYIIYGVKPTYSIYNYFVNDPLNEEFRSFHEIQVSFPLSIPPKSTNNLIIQYRADTNIAINPLGYYNAYLQIGYGVEPDTSIALSQLFHLFAKKTNKFIDGYEDLIVFDSTYINPPVGTLKKWRVKSTFQDSITIDEQKFSLLSQKLTQDEFFPLLYPINPTFRKKGEIIEWSISYLPQNMGRDTGMITLKYHPLPKQYPDSTQTAFVKVIGTGVKQELKLVSSNYSIKGDTIYLGDITTSQDIKINGKLLNLGNIPFNSINEEIVNPDILFNYSFNKRLIENRNYLMPDSTSSFEFELALKQKGSFVLKYEISSDIENRGFNYVPAGVSKKIIYIVGRAIQSEIQVQSDTIDFDRVYYYLPYCPSSKDTTFLIRNSGNDTLIIENIEFKNQYPTFAFSTEEQTLKILPNSTEKITIHFEPIIIQNYTAEMVLHNNSPLRQYKIYLKGTSTVPATTNLYIDTIKGKPGSIIEVPIKIDSNIVYANQFKDTIFYNRSILHYVGYKIENTAIEQPISQLSITEDIEGKLAINIQKPPKTRFKDNNKFIILLFKVFLGNAKSTAISFIDPLFGNEICDYALNLPKANVKNGLFITDSICGINLKVYPQKVVLLSAYPNPASDIIHCDFSIFEKTPLRFTIFNSMGELMYETAEEIYETGNYSKSFNLINYNSGIYNLRIFANNTIFSHQFLILK
jgi:hypothetical protein